MQNNVKYKVCNAINCFYANEYITLDNVLAEEEKAQGCNFCAYNFNNLCKTRTFLKKELEGFLGHPVRNIKQKACEIFIKILAFLAGIVIILYFINYFKLFSK